MSFRCDACGTYIGGAEAGDVPYQSPDLAQAGLEHQVCAQCMPALSSPFGVKLVRLAVAIALREVEEMSKRGVEGAHR